MGLGTHSEREPVGRPPPVERQERGPGPPAREHRRPVGVLRRHRFQPFEELAHPGIATPGTSGTARTSILPDPPGGTGFAAPPAAASAAARRNRRRPAVR